MSDLAPNIELPSSHVGVIRLDGGTFTKLFEMGAGSHDQLKKEFNEAVAKNNFVYYFYDIITDELIRSDP